MGTTSSRRCSVALLACLMPKSLREKILVLLDQFEEEAINDARSILINKLQDTPKQARTIPTPTSDIEQTLLDYVEKNPRQTITQIAAGLGVTVDDIRKPVKKFDTEKKLRHAGTGRGLRYSRGKR